jgi:hypothetical protein
MILNKLRRLIKKFVLECDKLSPKPRYYHIEMTENEISLFDQTVKESSHYLEFGMGGSTFRVLQKSKAMIHTVESSQDWIINMQKYLLIRYMRNRRLIIYHINIGPIGQWGHPVGTTSKHLFPRYSSDVFKFLNKGEIDTVLIDGRFRVACVLKTILEFHANENVTILIHDFYREEYHCVLEYLTEIERADNLCKFKIKHKVDLSSVKADYNKYKYNPN